MKKHSKKKKRINWTAVITISISIGILLFFGWLNIVSMNDDQYMDGYCAGYCNHEQTIGIYDVEADACHCQNNQTGKPLLSIFFNSEEGNAEIIKY